MTVEPSDDPLDDYFAEPADWGQAIARALVRAIHVLGEHLDAYANEGFIATATQWESVRRLVSMRSSPISWTGFFSLNLRRTSARVLSRNCELVTSKRAMRP